MQANHVWEHSLFSDFNFNLSSIQTPLSDQLQHLRKNKLSAWWLTHRQELSA